MFGKFLTKEKPQSQPEKMDPATESLLRAIAEKKKGDPLIGLKIGSEEIKKRIFDALKNDKGVNVDVVLRVLSALAGFSCQMAIRETLIKTGKATEKDVFMCVTTKDGGIYYMGDLLNKPLAKDQYSIWSLIGGAIQEAGSELPDLSEIFKYGIETIGTENFGKPRVDEKHLIGDTSQNFVKGLWPKLLPNVDMFCDTPAQRPILFGMALHKIIIQAKEVLDPTTAGILCMDTAVAMSKIDPKSIGIKN